MRGCPGTRVVSSVVSRALSASRVRPGDRLMTLDARRISGSTAVADTYPAGWENVNRLVNQDDLRFDSGWQISELRIGPLDADLQGEVVRTCGVKRLHRGFAAAGGTVTVTLTARNVTGMTTIVETFPDGWRRPADPHRRRDRLRVAVLGRQSAAGAVARGADVPGGGLRSRPTRTSGSSTTPTRSGAPAVSRWWSATR